ARCAGEHTASYQTRRLASLVGRRCVRCYTPGAARYSFHKRETAMLGEWGHIGMLVSVGIALPAVAIVVSVLLGIFKIRPNNPNKVKLDTYECGVETEGPSNIQFHVGYYVFALL